METKISKNLEAAAISAAKRMVKSRRVYLEKPFDGFYVVFSLEKGEKSFRKFSFVEGVDGEFHLVCESLLGKKRD